MRKALLYARHFGLRLAWRWRLSVEPEQHWPAIGLRLNIHRVVLLHHVCLTSQSIPPIGHQFNTSYRRHARPPCRFNVTPYAIAAISLRFMPVNTSPSFSIRHH